MPGIGSCRRCSPDAAFTLLKSSDADKPVWCSNELSLPLGVQLIVLRLEGAQSSSSSWGIESCRRECPGWPSTVRDMQAKVCVECARLCRTRKSSTVGFENQIHGIDRYFR